MLRYLALMGGVFICAAASSGCEEEDGQSELYYDADIAFVEEADPSALERTNYYVVSNPTAGGCASALRLTARGTGITQIRPSGCWIDQLGPTPSWDTLSSTGTNTLVDTWYLRGSAFDKDNTSASWQAWCSSTSPVTVRVTGTTITQLQYWFTDDTRCFW